MSDDAVAVRDSQPADEAWVADLLAELGYPVEPERVCERLHAFAADPSSIVLVAEGAAGVVGLASASVMPLFHEDGTCCRLSALVVAAASRRAGVGQALLAAIEA